MMECKTTYRTKYRFRDKNGEEYPGETVEADSLKELAARVKVRDDHHLFELVWGNVFRINTYIHDLGGPLGDLKKRVERHLDCKLEDYDNEEPAG